MEDILGWGWGSLVHPDDLARVVGEWQAAFATGEPMESEARLRRMDGEYRWLLIRNVPLRDTPGNIVSWYGTAIDIEERHRAEDALRQSEACLAQAQRLSHTGSGLGTLAPSDFLVGRNFSHFWRRSQYYNATPESSWTGASGRSSLLSDWSKPSFTVGATPIYNYRIVFQTVHEIYLQCRHPSATTRAR